MSTPQIIEIDDLRFKVYLSEEQIQSRISELAEEISKDYHEENAFKKYLQAKWSELLNHLKAS